MLYLTVKAVHVIAVIAWMAGLLYLPRLFVYHANVDPQSDQSALFKVMEWRLLWGIMTPSLVLVWATGIILALSGGFFQMGWLHAKLSLVILLTATHLYLWRCLVLFSRDLNQRTSRFYRLINELPTLLMIGIVFLVVLKPF